MPKKCKAIILFLAQDFRDVGQILTLSELLPYQKHVFLHPILNLTPQKIDPQFQTREGFKIRFVNHPALFIDNTRQMNIKKCFLLKKTIANSRPGCCLHLREPPQRSFHHCNFTVSHSNSLPVNNALGTLFFLAYVYYLYFILFLSYFIFIDRYKVHWLTLPSDVLEKELARPLAFTADFVFLKESNSRGYLCRIFL